MKPISALLVAFILTAQPSYAVEKEVSVVIHKVSPHGVEEEIGKIVLTDTAQGLQVTPQLKGLPPGPHGFHIHQNPSCAPAEKDGKMSAAEAAGGHLDPLTSGKHEGPEGHGHLGDLPILAVNTDGTATTSVLAPRLSLNKVRGHSVMIHEGSDNFSDTPAKLGGGGARIACGVIAGKSSHS